MPYPETLIVLDVETTGVDPAEDKLIEVSACLYKDGKIADTFDSLVHFDGELPTFVRYLTGIEAEELLTAPKFSEIKDKLQEFIGEHPIVGHNIGFDIAFLEAAGIECKGPAVDTYILAGIVLPKQKSYSLEALAHTFEIEHRDKHRALADVYATIDLFSILWDKACSLDKGVLQKVNDLLGKSDFSCPEFFTFAAEQASDQTPKSHSVAPKVVDDWFHDPESPFFDYSIETKEAVEKFSSEYMSHLDQSVALALEIDCGADERMAVQLPLLESSHSSVMVTASPAKQERWLEFGSIYGSEAVHLLYDPSAYFSVDRYELLCKKEKLTVAEALLLAKSAVWLQHTKTGIGYEIGLLKNEKELFQALLACSQADLEDPTGFLATEYQRAKRAKMLIAHPRALLSDNKIVQEVLRKSEVLCLDDIEHFEDQLRFQYDYRLGSNDVSQFLLTAQSFGQVFKGAESIAELITDFEREVSSYFMVLHLFVRSFVENEAYYTTVMIDDVKDDSDYENVKTSLQDLKTKWENLQATLEQHFEGEDLRAIEYFQAGMVAFDIWMQKLEEVILGKEGGVSFIQQNVQGDITLHMLPENLGTAFQKDVAEHFSKKLLVGGLMSSVHDEQQEGILTRYIQTVFDFKETIPCHALHLASTRWKDAKLIVPTDIPFPNSSNYLQAIQEVVTEVAELYRGGIIGVFNSNSAIKETHKGLIKHFQKGDMSILAQGITGGKGKVVGAYKREPEKTILFGTRYFWHAIDLADSLAQVLLLQKFPFDFPNDPILSIQTKHYNNVFADYSLPKALFRAKFLVEKFLLSDGDKKYVLFFDRRIIDKDYGKVFLKLFLPENIIECTQSEVGSLMK